MLVVLACIQIGCSRNTLLTGNGEYKILTEKNNLCSFSFEYSDYYELAGPRYVFDFDPPFVYLTLLAPKVTTDTIGGQTLTSAVVEYVPASIQITVTKAMDSVNTAADAEEEIDELLKDAREWASFRLVDRYRLFVAGAQGDLIEYYVRAEHKSGVYFDHAGLIWSIELRSKDDRNYAQSAADFDHIVQTFKILDAQATKE